MNIEKARLLASEKLPYLTSMIYSLRFLETSKMPGYAGITKEGIFIYNSELVDEIDEESFATIILNRSLHLLFEHFERQQAGSFESNIFNFSGDLEINDDLLSAGCKIPVNNKDELLLPFPHLFGVPSGLLVEEYYEIFKQAADKCKSGKCGSKGGSGTGNKMDGEEEIVGEEQGNLTKENLERIKSEVASAALEHQKQGGFVPGGLRRIIDKLHAVKKIDWRKQLSKHIKFHIGNASGILNPTFSKISRRQHVSKNTILPSYINPIPSIGLLVDTSGSMTEEDLAKGLAHIKHILAQFNSEVWVIVVDAVVHAFFRARHVRDISAKMIGGGGTVFTEAIPMIDAKKCSCVVAISDCFASYPTKNPKTPFIWLSSYEDSNPPFGKVIVIED